MGLRGVAGGIWLAAACLGCDEPPVGPQPDRPIVLSGPIPERSGPPARRQEQLAPVPDLPPPPAEVAAPPTLAPNVALAAAWASRDTDGVWTKLVSEPKSEALAAALRARALDAQLPEGARQASLDALRTEDAATQLLAWQAEVATTAPGGAARVLALKGLVSVGNAAAVNEAFTHLGESEALDLALLSMAAGERLALATPSLRVYQRTKKPTARVQASLKKLLVKPAKRKGR